MRVLTLWAAALCAALLFAACSGGSGTEISMTPDQRYDPPVVTVGAGEEITWVNDSEETHTVTGDEGRPDGGRPYFASGGFESEEEALSDVAGGLIEPGDSFSVTLDEPGTYRYFCIPHRDSGMTGEIVVEP